jgi:hypothetical protein
MKTKFYAEANIPKGSGDAEYRIIADLGGGVLTNKVILAIIDPSMVLDDPALTADAIADALNADPEAIL